MQEDGGWSFRWPKRSPTGAARSGEMGIPAAWVSIGQPASPPAPFVSSIAPTTLVGLIHHQKPGGALTQFLFPFLATATLWMALGPSGPPSVPLGLGLFTSFLLSYLGLSYFLEDSVLGRAAGRTERQKCVEDPWAGTFLQVTVRMRMHPDCLLNEAPPALGTEYEAYGDSKADKGPSGGVNPKASYSRGPLRFKPDSTPVTPPDLHHGQRA